MSDKISGSPGVASYGPFDPISYQSRSINRSDALNESALYATNVPSAEQISELQGFYNSCLSNISQFRSGCQFPDPSSMIMNDPRMMTDFMKSQHMRHTSGQLKDPKKSQINGLLENTAQKYGIPPDILKAVAWQESRWNPKAVGDNGKSHGLMQINSKAHPDYNVQKGKTDPSYNIEYGAKFLRSLHDRTGSWEKAVERYNGSGPMARKYASSVMNHYQHKPWLS